MQLSSSYRILMCTNLLKGVMQRRTLEKQTDDEIIPAYRQFMVIARSVLTQEF